MTGLVPTWEDLRRFVQSLLARRWIRFGLMGGLATLCYALLGLLFVNVWALPLLAGNGLAYLISFFVSYLGQSLWTFQARGGHRAMLPRFAATQAVGLGLNSCIVWLLVHLGLAYEFAMPVAVVLVPVFVYLLCKYWVSAGRGSWPDPPQQLRRQRSREHSRRVRDHELPEQRPRSARGSGQPYGPDLWEF